MKRITAALWMVASLTLTGLSFCVQSDAQQMGVGIRVPWVCADGTMFEAQNRCPKTIDPPVKIGPEERIRTMADAERIARKQK
jgi:hypothetical protein